MILQVPVAVIQHLDRMRSPAANPGGFATQAGSVYVMMAAAESATTLYF